MRALSGAGERKWRFCHIAPPHRARNADEVMQATESAGYGRLDEVGMSLDACTSADPDVVEEVDSAHLRANHQAAKAPVPEKHVGALTQ